MGAVVNFIAASFITGVVNLNLPTYHIERSHVVACSRIIGVLILLINLKLAHRLNQLASCAVVFDVALFIAVSFPFG